MPERPLEVLHVFEALGQGGAEQNLLSILQELPPPRFRHHLAWLRPHPNELRDAFAPLVESMVPLHDGPRWSHARATRVLTRWLRAHRPDLVHAQMIGPQLVCRAAAALTRVPVVTTWQNALYEEHGRGEFGHSRARQEIVRWLDRLSGARDRHFIAVSEHVARSCAAHLGVSDDRVTVIYNSVDPRRYQAGPPEALARLRGELGLGAGELVLLAVGRLSHQKRHHDTIAAMPDVLVRQPRAVLLLAGRGPLEAALGADVAARGLGGAVRLLGFRPDVPLLYQLADLFVFPSSHEGLSVALVEALANGLPAVVSDIPQNREAASGVEEAVRFVPVGQPAALSRAITSALGERVQLKAAALAARDPVRSRFAPNRLAVAFAKTMLAAAGRGSAPPSP